MESMDTIIFIIASAILLWVSRKNLLQPRSHGFYRFLAWECMLLLLLRNYSFWFDSRFAWYQLLSWCLLFLSIVFVVLGSIQLRQHGAATSQRDHENLLSFEKTSKLVSTGIYRYISHPLYGSLLLLTWGLFFKQPFSLLGISLALIASSFLVLTAKIEEQENRAYFGEAYVTYQGSTKRFLPWVW